MTLKDLPPLQILFADDDSDEIYLFNEALEHCCAHAIVNYVNDGNSLLSSLKNNPLPDVVILDINMPYKDGLEALVEIRKVPDFADVPLIVYSTVKNKNIIESSFQKGASLFVVKPNNFDGMVQFVNKVCSIDWKNNPKLAREEFVLAEQ